MDDEIPSVSCMYDVDIKRKKKQQHAFTWLNMVQVMFLVVFKDLQPVNGHILNTLISDNHCRDIRYCLWILQCL